MNLPQTDTGAPRAHQLAIEFTGSGSEYFRIWIVNLLLTLVTLGIYLPWAKARRLRYFYGNTLVGGEPLGFHGNPRKMFKGYVLIGVLFALYSAAGNFSVFAGAVALVLVAAIAPALLRASMQFRLANTSWRGLRFSFNGSQTAAYRAALPLLVPGAAIFVGLVAAMYVGVPPAWQSLMSLVILLASLGVLPWLFWKLKQYQHNNYALASLQTTFTASAGSFYRLLAQIIGVAVMVFALPLVLLAAWAFSQRGAAVGPGLFTTAVMSLLPLLAMFSVFVMVKPYLTSRLQNLVWTRTRNNALYFLSDLRFKALLWLTLKNWLLIVLTLGLYWPFAAVAQARLRLQAVTVYTLESPDLLVGQARAMEGDAAGDAAGDLFGLDIGL